MVVRGSSAKRLSVLLAPAVDSTMLRMALSPTAPAVPGVPALTVPAVLMPSTKVPSATGMAPCVTV